MKKTTLYFEKTGPENTGILLSAAKERLQELGIKDIVVATTHGGTAIQAQEALGPDLNIVAVTISEGFKDKGWTITPSRARAFSLKTSKATNPTPSTVYAPFIALIGARAPGLWERNGIISLTR